MIGNATVRIREAFMASKQAAQQIQCNDEANDMTMLMMAMVMMMMMMMMKMMMTKRSLPV